MATFGNTGSSSSQYYILSSDMGASLAILPKAGSITSISFLAGNFSEPPERYSMVAIYSDSGGKPNLRLTASTSGSIHVTPNAWNTVNISKGLESGSYWLTIGEKVSHYIKASGTGFTTYEGDLDIGANFPTSFTIKYTNSDTWGCHYATYTQVPVQSNIIYSNAKIAGAITGSTSIPSDGRIKVISSSELASDSRIKKISYGEITSDARVYGGAYSIISSDSRIKKLSTSEIASDTRIKTASSGEIVGDARIKALLPSVIVSDARIKAESSLQATSDARVKKLSSSTIASDSRIKELSSATTASDTRIKEISSLSITSDSRIKEIIFSEIVSDARITGVITTGYTTITSDANIRGAIPTKPRILDSELTGLIEDSRLTNNLKDTRMTGQIEDSRMISTKIME